MKGGPTGPDLERTRDLALELLRDTYSKGDLTTPDLEQRTELVENAQSPEEVEAVVRDLVPASAPVSSDRVQPSVFSLLASRKVKRPLAEFQGTRVGGFMSETRLDLREGSPARGHIEVFGFLSSVHITVTPETVVELDVVPVMGEAKEKGKVRPSLNSPFLRVTGFLFMASLEIRRKDR
jgi:hypothetical protein